MTTAGGPYCVHDDAKHRVRCRPSEIPLAKPQLATGCAALFKEQGRVVRKIAWPAQAAGVERGVRARRVASRTEPNEVEPSRCSGHRGAAGPSVGVERTLYVYAMRNTPCNKPCRERKGFKRQTRSLFNRPTVRLDCTLSAAALRHTAVIHLTR